MHQREHSVWWWNSDALHLCFVMWLKFIKAAIHDIKKFNNVKET